jgi:hypothetical protein
VPEPSPVEVPEPSPDDVSTEDAVSTNGAAAEANAEAVESK